MGSSFVCKICKQNKELPYFWNERGDILKGIVCLECKEKQEAKIKEKHLKYLRIAKIYAEMSNCVSHQVGAILVKDGRIISTGYNGTPAGYKNCNEIFPDYSKENDRQVHMEFSDRYELHSEQNLLIQAAREGISIKDSILYCTTQPCWTCLKMMIGAGIKEIYFTDFYDRINSDENWWDFVKDMKVKIERIGE